MLSQKICSYDTDKKEKGLQHQDFCQLSIKILFIFIKLISGEMPKLKLMKRKMDNIGMLFGYKSILLTSFYIQLSIYNCKCVKGSSSAFTFNVVKNKTVCFNFGALLTGLENLKWAKHICLK